MAKAPWVVECCPACKAEFKASSVPNPVNGRNMGKICPNGHWTRIDVLAALRNGKAMKVAPVVLLPEPEQLPIDIPVVRKTIGDYSLALEGMVDAFERLQSQFPAGSKSQAMAVGVFLQPVIIAKKVLGRIA